ncbi:SLC13 family permease, partial [bacterium]|nr:SLC13 family permease [bacterium]
MTFDILFMLVLLAALLGFLIFTRVAPDVLFLGALTILFVSNQIDASEALSGFSNPGMITVGALYIVVCGLRETGGIAWIVHWGLGRPKSSLQAKMRLMVPVTALSAFLNNTPVVGMFIPAVIDWAKKNNLSVSKLLIPLSYASIFGGTCTLIGTSTNLIVNGLMISETGGTPFHVFSIAWVGVPSALIGLTYMFLFSDWLLPDRRPSIGAMQDPREYTVEMMVEANSPLVGRSIESAGLRSLPGLFLMEIERAGHIIPAVAPHEELEANDRLVFVGIVDSIVDLQKIRGLAPATNQVFKLDAPRTERVLVEAVVSNSCPLVGKTIREGRFRTIYNAAVIAVARNGERINKKIGDIILRPGDTLLLEAPPTFSQQARDSRDFFLVSQLQDSQPFRHERGLFALIILAAMVLSAALNIFSMLEAAMIAAGLMIVMGCCASDAARKSIDWQVLLVIAASLGVGHAMDKSGTALFIANGFISFAGSNPLFALAMIYLITTVFTELITNNAAAVLVFPIAYATANTLGVSFTPFAVAIMMAASASFSSPIGYQTNLMVYGPGGYRF